MVQRSVKPNRKPVGDGGVANVKARFANAGENVVNEGAVGAWCFGGDLVMYIVCVDESNDEALGCQLDC